ncbi:DNA-3-methyladenine glycosylase I [Veillonella sp. R32]|uniref:DNA-3-methyladenine glycosylase I n=1 Tax=Veillonella sp. R32 TaxID=2021312 RepID=UPI003519EDF8
MSTMEGQCTWAGRSELEQLYHDTEWGVPVHEDDKLFEMLILEGMQAGLSWTIVIKRREAMREAFDGFDVATLAQYTPEKEAALLQNPNIIRHRLKVAALRKNAVAFQRVQAEFGSFDAYIWHFTEGKTIIGHWQNQAEVPASIPLAETISKDLKKRGFTFVGPTIIYSFLQAIGIVNDHIVTCPVYKCLVANTEANI